MGYYRLISEDTIVEGNFDESAYMGSTTTDSHALSNIALHNGILQTQAPFQLVTMYFTPADPVRTRISVITPGAYNYFEYEQIPFKIHQHNTFELVYIQEGTLLQRIESERHIYPAGSFLLLNRNVRHCEEADTAFCTVSLSLSADYFKELLLEDRNQVFKTGYLWGDNTDLQEFLSAELFGSGNVGKNYIDFIPLQPKQCEEDPIRDLFEQMTSIIQAPKPGDTFVFRALICRLLYLLCQRDLFTTRPISLGTRSESRIFSQINQLLEESNGRISRNVLVEKLSYSGCYLNKIVQTFTGMNITQYSLFYSLKRAAWLLVNSDETITNIAADLGFTNRSYFYTEFQKRYGLTPREYRINKKEIIREEAMR